MILFKEWVTERSKVVVLKAIVAKLPRVRIPSHSNSGYSSTGRAVDCGPKGCGFKSHYPPFLYIIQVLIQEMDICSVPILL